MIEVATAEASEGAATLAWVLSRKRDVGDAQWDDPDRLVKEEYDDLSELDDDEDDLDDEELEDEEDLDDEDADEVEVEELDGERSFDELEEEESAEDEPSEWDR